MENPDGLFRQLDTDRDDTLSRQEFMRIATVTGTTGNSGTGTSGTTGPGTTSPR